MTCNHSDALGFVSWQGARSAEKEWGQVLNGAPLDSFSDSCAIQDLTPFFSQDLTPFFSFFLRIRASQQRRHGTKYGAGGWLQ